MCCDTVTLGSTWGNQVALGHSQHLAVTHMATRCFKPSALELLLLSWFLCGRFEEAKGILVTQELIFWSECSWSNTIAEHLSQVLWTSVPLLCSAVLQRDRRSDFSSRRSTAGVDLQRWS